MTETARRQAEDNPNAVLNIGGDSLKPSLAKLVESGAATEEQASLVWWYFCHCKSNGFGTKRCAREIGVEATTIYRVFNCSYRASLAQVCARIRNYKRAVEERAGLNELPFVVTSVAASVEQVCHAAWLSQSVAMIWGESQIGKTYALQHYAANHNHGQTKYVRIPAAATKTIAAQELARSCYVSADGGWHTIRDRVVRAVDANNLMLVDEFHELFVSTSTQNAVAVLDFLRELHDRSGCGLVLCSTNIGRDAVESGKLAPILKQLSKRGVVKLQLPDLAPIADYWLLASEIFGLAKPTDQAIVEVVKTLRHKSGIGVFSDYLKMGARLAKNKGEDYTWNHFAAAHDALAALSKTTN